MKTARKRGSEDGARAVFLLAWSLAALWRVDCGAGVVLYGLTRSVRETVQPEQVSLWLRRPDEGP